MHQHKDCSSNQPVGLHQETSSCSCPLHTKDFLDIGHHYHSHHPTQDMVCSQYISNIHIMKQSMYLSKYDKYETIQPIKVSFTEIISFPHHGCSNLTHVIFVASRRSITLDNIPCPLTSNIDAVSRGMKLIWLPNTPVCPIPSCSIFPNIHSISSIFSPKDKGPISPSFKKIILNI